MSHADHAVSICRIEVRCRPSRPDPRADAVARKAAQAGLRPERVACAKVYFLEGPLNDEAISRIKSRLLADPVTETAVAGVQPAHPDAQIVEVHPQPGVMDPAAQSVRDAVRDLTGISVGVSTGVRYDFVGVDADDALDFTRHALANPVIHDITHGPWLPESLPRGHEHPFKLSHIPLRGLTDADLVKLARDAHLFLSLAEMKAIQAEFEALGRDPTDIELETIAQTWSEHCVHKTLKANITYRHASHTSPADDPIDWNNRPGHSINPDKSVSITNLLKSSVAAATFELMADGVTWPLSVFKDNSGVVALDDHWGVCIKVETHNHPSAIEPYGGAATGAGGCIRDVMGTGLGAKPIANTDIFCVAHPDRWHAADAAPTDPAPATRPLPPGTLHPRRILGDIVAGVRDYGNRIGIPTVAGAVHFDDRYVGNPLVFCGCVGLIPRDLIHAQASPGDRIIALGGRTGRDGIHGATFSSAELEHTAADEFAHAVQIGNAIEEKRLLDAILRARDAMPPDEDDESSVAPGKPLFSAITDCGAGGFSSAVGEMGATIGAHVHLENAPLKYAGLSYTEIWISEAQERMILAVPPQNLPALKRICDEEGVELADLGEFGTPDAQLILSFHGNEVARLPMEFLHEGIPTPTREASWPPPKAAATPATTSPQRTTPQPTTPGVGAALTRLLSHPSIASKHWIIRQYDHEVQGNTILRPLVGPAGRGPGNGSVLEPIPGSGVGVALACGLNTGVGDPALGGDPYLMALAGVDECVRNLVCMGADPARIAILDNFCWPSCEKPENLGALVRACEGCYDAAKAYRTPFVSGKDSLNNQLRYDDPVTGQRTVIEIPFTLLISGLGIVHDISTCITPDAKQAGNLLLLVGEPTGAMGGSLYQHFAHVADVTFPRVDLSRGPALAAAIHALIKSRLVASAHDCSEGGALVAIAEMLIATSGRAGHAPLGADLDPRTTLSHASWAFGEAPSRYILEVTPEALPKVESALGAHPHAVIGTLTSSSRLRWSVAQLDAGVDDLAKAWLAPLDW